MGNGNGSQGTNLRLKFQYNQIGETWRRVRSSVSSFSKSSSSRCFSTKLYCELEYYSVPFFRGFRHLAVIFLNAR